MSGIKYIIVTRLKYIYRNKKRYILYFVFSFTAILLPAFCIANYSNINLIKNDISKEYLEDITFINWRSVSSRYDLINSVYKPSYKVIKKIEFDEGKIYQVTGIDQVRNKLKTYKIIGRLFEESDFLNKEKVCILNTDDLNDCKFKPGEKIKIGKESYKIIGIIETYISQNTNIYIPITTFSKYMINGIDSYQFSAEVIIDKSKDRQKVLEEIEKSVSSVQPDFFRTSSGLEYKNSILEKYNKATSIRILLIAVSVIFFSLNSLIFILSKIEEEKTNIAIRLTMGASLFGEILGFLLETLIISILSTTFVLLFISKIVKLSSVDKYITLNFFTIKWTFITSFLIFFFIFLCYINKISKIKICDVLNKEC